MRWGLFDHHGPPFQGRFKTIEMPFIKTPVTGLLVFEPTVFEDSRGYFFESYNQRTFYGEGIGIDFIQDNQARSSYGVVRGLHYQLEPHAQTKLIRVLSGEIVDAAVDLRLNSPTYGTAYTILLSASNKKQLLIPKGFAHGYSVISETAEVFYKCDGFYDKPSEGGIAWNDPSLQIDWQLPAESVRVSEKDAMLPLLKNVVHNFVFKE